MRYAVTWHDARVKSFADIAPDIRCFEIEPLDGAPRPYAPGSHINIGMLIEGKPEHRSYSLVGQGEAGAYRIAVKRQKRSRGGSAYMWSLTAGARLSISEPHNLFEIEFGKPDYLLIAGGIGITPLLGIARGLLAKGEKMRFHYACRARADAVFADELMLHLGERFMLHLGAEGRRLDVAAEIERLAPGGQLYICGPIGLLEAARGAWQAQGRPAADLRFETFGSSGRFAPEPFRLKIPQRGLDIEVAETKSMLDALAEAGIEVMADCRRGECGLCALDIVGGSGEIDHRDVFFSEEERRRNKKVCACVSRVVGGDIVVDLHDRAP